MVRFLGSPIFSSEKEVAKEDGCVKMEESLDGSRIGFSSPEKAMDDCVWYRTDVRVQGMEALMMHGSEWIVLLCTYASSGRRDEKGLRRSARRICRC